MTMRRGGRFAVLAIAAMAAIGVARAGDKDDGFFIFLDAAYVSPQNTDEVLATTQEFGTTYTVATIRTDFGNDFAGRVGFGYKWKGGGSIGVQYWKFDTDERTRADGPAGGFMNFAIGPPQAYYVAGYGYTYPGTFGYPGSLDMKSTIKAQTLDLVWARDHELTENLVLGWSLGLRYAKFEESVIGKYDYYDSANPLAGQYTYGIAKHNEGKMSGFKAGLRVTRNFGEHFAVTSGLGFSFLKGKIESSSGMTPIGTVNTLIPGLTPSFASATDKDRTGLIRDFDVGCYLRIAHDHFRVGVGWEQSSWDGVPQDLVRNNVGSLVNPSERNNVTFSSWKIGLYARF